MKSSSSERGRAVGAIIVAGILSGVLPAFWPSVAFAQSGSQAPKPPSATPQLPSAIVQSPSAPAVKAWRESMSRTPAPRKGCFRSSYPSVEWQEVPCTKAPKDHDAPRIRPAIVGNLVDWSAFVPNGSISSARGSFDSVKGVTFAGDSRGANTYSLQVNTNVFGKSNCYGHPSCLGWQQFVYRSNSGINLSPEFPDLHYGYAYIEYWLLEFGSSCPSGWDSDNMSCVRRSDAVFVPPVPIEFLSFLGLKGSAANGTDTLVMSRGSELFAVSDTDRYLDLEGHWSEAEFNIFGMGNSTQVNFNQGSTIVVRTTVDDGTTTPPICFADGRTAETNNLNLLSPCCPYGGISPSIVFTESNVPGATARCDGLVNVAGVQEGVRYFLREFEHRRSVGALVPIIEYAKKSLP